MVEGKDKFAIAITEPDSGSDALSMEAYAHEEGDHYVLNGNKMFISNGPVASVFVVIAVTQKEPVKRYTAFICGK